MNKKDWTEQAINIKEIQKCSQYFVNQFIKAAGLYFQIDVNLVFYPTKEAFQTKQSQKTLINPIYSEKHGNCVTIYLCEELLKEVHPLALQGWLDQELAYHILRLRDDLNTFNFSRQILPLLSVSGSAVNFIRHIVEYLKSGLDGYLSTKLLIDLGHISPQIYYHFFKINPIPGEREDYQKMIPHHWIRTSFLCQKLKEFIAIDLLAKKNADFSQDLKGFWWNHNQYLLLEDQRLLEDLSAVPDKHCKEPYAANILEMFKKIEYCLLSGFQTPMTSKILH